MSQEPNTPEEQAQGAGPAETADSSSRASVDGQQPYGDPQSAASDSAAESGPSVADNKPPPEEAQAALWAALVSAGAASAPASAAATQLSDADLADEVAAAMQALAESPADQDENSAASEGVTVAESAAGSEAAAMAEPFVAPDLSAGGEGSKPAAISLLDDVELDVKIELGRTQMYIEDVLRLGVGSVVELDKLASDPVDIYVNSRLVARGEVLVLNDNFCVRINGILSPIPELEDDRR